MFLQPLHLPLISSGYFGGTLARIIEFVLLRVRRSDEGQMPSLSLGLRTQTIALHRRLWTVASEFQRIARLAQAGRLRVYPDRASPTARPEGTAARSRAARPSRRAWASPFRQIAGVFQGPTLPALPTRGFGWMLGFVPASYCDPLPLQLRQAEMVALIGASPTVARLLRSLCHGLGIARPEGVFPALRRRKRRAARGSQVGARMDLGSGTGELHDTAGPGVASRAREPAIVMSPQARERWWAEHRGGGRSAGASPGAGDAPRARDATDSPARGRCAKG